jgi:HSP20 family molecular chaperone IbpA
MAADNQELQNRAAEEPTSPERTREAQVFSPQADVFETGDSIVVVADMPGVSEADVDITLERNILTISGHHPSTQREGYRMIYGEFEEGDYERSFALSEGVDRDSIEATVSNGVLRLTLPKAKEAATRKIPVRAS